MIEWINEYFGVDNNVSVPVFITLFVFFTGGLVNFLFKLYASVISKKNTRSTFRKLIERTIKELRKKEKYMKVLIDTLNIEYGGNWSLTYVNLSYIDTFFDFNYTDIFIAFNRKYSLCTKQKGLRETAFHRTWSLLRGLKFIEEPSYNMLKIMIDKYNIHKNLYGDGLENYQKSFEKVAIAIDGQSINKTYAEFFSKLDKIFSDWQQKDPATRTFPFITYTDIIFPSLEVCKKYSKIPDSRIFMSSLLQSTNEFMEMKNVLIMCRKQYYHYYYFYRTSCRLLEKILLILRK